MRQITLPEMNEKEGYYYLDWRILLKNMHTSKLLFGSPRTAGRADAGYGGLCWRGHPSFKGDGGRIMAGNGLEGPDTIEHRAP